MNGSSDITARLRLTGEASGAVKAASDAGGAVQDLSQKAGQAKGQLEGAAAGARGFQQSATAAGAAADAASRSMGGMAAATGQVSGAAKMGAVSFAELYDAANEDFFAQWNAGAAQFISSSGKVGGQAKLTIIQMLELGHVGRSLADGLMAGIPPMQLIAMEGGRIVEVLGSGPSGVMGTLKAIGSAVLPFAAWVPPLVAVGGTIALLVEQMHSFKEQQEEVRKATNEVAADTIKSLHGMDQAAGFAEKYHVSTDAVWASLEHVLDSQGMVNSEVKKGIGATDDAARAAKDRAELERLLNVELLRRNALEAQQRADALKKDLKGIQRSSAISAGFSAGGDDSMPLDLGKADRAYQDAFRKRRGEELQKDIKLEQDIYAANMKLADQVQASHLTVDVKAPRANRGEQRAPNELTDLKALQLAEDAHTAAIVAGGKALDDWKIKEAGRQALEKSGLTHKANLSAAEQALADRIRGTAEATEALKLANERIQKSVGMTQTANIQAQALREQAAAAMQGEAALEAWRIKEAGVQAQRELGVKNLDELTPKTRAYVEAAIDAARAKEAEAIATEKAQRVATTLRDLGQQIDQEKARTVAILGGTKAEVEYARTLAIRQAIAKAGTTITAEQTIAIIEQVDALFKLKAANDAADFTKQEREQLDLLRLTNQEREVEQRYLRIKKDLEAQGLQVADQELQARARAQAMAEQAAADDARAIGDLKQSLRQAFIETGKLSFDDIGKYAEQRLRAAVYDALLAKPIEVLINAVVSGVSGADGQGGLAGALGTIGKAAGNISIPGLGMTIAQAAPYAAMVLAVSQIDKALSKGIVSALGGDARQQRNAANWGQWFGTIGGLIAAAVGGKESNHSATAVFTGDTYSIVGDKQTKETTTASKGAADAYLAGLKLIEQFGITLTTTVKDIDLGSRDATHVHLSNGQDIRTAMGDPAAAAEAALKAVLDDANYLDDAQKKLVQNMEAAGKGFQDIAAELQNYADAQKLSANFADAILQLTDPEAFAKKQLADQQQARRDQVQAAYTAGYITADQLATINGQLKTLEGLELDQVLKQFGHAVDDAASAAQKLAEQQQSAKDLQGSVEDQIMQILNPDAYAVKKIYDEINAERAQAQPLIDAGLLPQSFMDQLTELQQLKVADALKNLTAAADAATVAFQQARPQLIDWLDQVAQGPSSELSPAEQRQSALEAYQRQLALARGGDASALSNITGYADRLLSADRNATSSAQDRLALYRQVTGDISALAAQGSPADRALASVQDGMVTLAEAAKKQLEQAQAAEAAGGSPVLIANLPSLQATYGVALQDQTALLIAANDKTRTELGSKLDAAVDAINSLHTTTGAGLTVVANNLDGVVEAVEAVAGSTDDMRREQQLTNGFVRQAAAR